MPFVLIIQRAFCMGLFLIVGNVHACIPDFKAPVEFARSAQWIGFAYVTGEQFPNYEARVLKNREPQTHQIYEQRLARVAFVRMLKGKNPKILEMVVPCAAPFPGQMEKVLIAHLPDGRDWILLNEWEAEITSALRV